MKFFDISCHLLFYFDYTIKKVESLIAVRPSTNMRFSATSVAIAATRITTAIIATRAITTVRAHLTLPFD
jgi:hypothetical protein